VLSETAFDDIVAGFYKASGGDLSWNEALVPFQRAFDAWAIYVHGLDLRLGRIEFAHIASSIPLQAELDYLQKYHRIDPRAALAFNAQPGEWFNCWEIFDDAFVARDPFYQEYLLPYGGRYVSGTALHRKDDTLVMLGVHRGLGKSKLSLDEIATCRRLARHLSEATRLHQATVNLQAKVRLGTQLLSRLHFPIVVLDAQRRIEQINAAGQELLSRTKAAFQKNDSLYLASPRDDASFLIELRRVLSAAGQGSDGRFYLQSNPKGVVAPIAFYVTALKPAETLHAFSDHPIAMVVVHEPNARAEIDPYVVQMAYGFTPAESRVAITAAHGASPKEMALQFGLSPHTVRTQLKGVFSKVGVSKQSELVSRLLTLPSLR
jgi:DNA-binding CsgD family transcriptional regulator/PAS domain-containing protein